MKATRVKIGTKFKHAGEHAAVRQRRLQSKIQKIEKNRPPEREKAAQLGARKYPAPPFSEKPKTKPGKEKTLGESPLYDAPYYLGSRKLENKIAIITGGDSGIGRSVAVLFAREGANISIVYLNEHDDAKETCRLVEQEGRKCIVIPGDVTDPKFCQYAAKETIKEFGAIDILINNAAFQLHVPDMMNISEAHFDTTLKTNLYGYFHMTMAALPFIKYGGCIVNTGSVTGLMGNKGIPDYSLTKGGIHAWTRSLGTRLLAKGIRVNAVAPGPVWTPLNPADKNKKDLSRFGSHTPMKRPAQPEEIAPAYVFLASAQCSSYITGEVIPIIGGYTGG